MNTYFIRHTSALDIDNDTFDELWDKDFFGIHYPHDSEGILQEEDLSSLDWQDYYKQGQSAIKILNRIAKEGGYIFATYENKPNCKVGLVNKGTPVKLLEGKWGEKNNRKGRKAILKVLKFSQVKEIDPISATSLTVVQPRQGTICQWSKVGRRVEFLFRGITEKNNIADLTPDQQEVLCSEFLRHHIISDYELPRIQSLLTPVGRTMKDIDIMGITNNNRKVVAQVTYSEIPDWKIDRLKKYAIQENIAVILFCKADKIQEREGVKIFPLDLVFKLFCKQTDEGKIWLKNLI